MVRQRLADRAQDAHADDLALGEPLRVAAAEDLRHGPLEQLRFGQALERAASCRVLAQLLEHRRDARAEVLGGLREVPDHAPTPPLVLAGP